MIEIQISYSMVATLIALVVIGLFALLWLIESITYGPLINERDAAKQEADFYREVGTAAVYAVNQDGENKDA